MDIANVVSVMEGLAPDEVRMFVVASICVYAIQHDTHPAAVLQAFDDAMGEAEWERVRQAIIVRGFEEQMGAATPPPPPPVT